MRILLLNQVFHPDVVATSLYLSELAAALAARGHEVTVICSRRGYEDTEKNFRAKETWSGVKILRVSSTRLGKGAKWRRAADFASFLIMCWARLLFLKRQDAVVALTTPPLISFLGALRAKLWRARFCYWIMDFNPDEAIAAGWLREGSLAAKFLEKISRFSLRNADKIIALDRFMRDRIAAKNIPGEKIAVIPPWSLDGSVRFDAEERKEFRQKHGLEDKFVVMYSGNHSPVHPLETLMQAAEQLRAEKNVVFCFVGGGSEFKNVKQWAEETKNPQVLCLPYQPLDKLAGSLSAADAHVVVMGDAMRGLVHPCKIYNILAVGAPVIYIGPTPSHVTEAIAMSKGQAPLIEARHGEARRLAGEIMKFKGLGWHENRRSSVVHAFSANHLLPDLIEVVEGQSHPAQANTHRPKYSKNSG